MFPIDFMTNKEKVKINKILRRYYKLKKMANECYTEYSDIVSLFKVDGDYQKYTEEEILEMCNKVLTKYK